MKSNSLLGPSDLDTDKAYGIWCTDMSVAAEALQWGSATGWQDDIISQSTRELHGLAFMPLPSLNPYTLSPKEPPQRNARPCKELRIRESQVRKNGPGYSSKDPLPANRLQVSHYPEICILSACHGIEKHQTKEKPVIAPRASLPVLPASEPR